ncbi:MAG: sigma-70 family RNA polymerase sigma factor [Proteobacteria bacterium]|nr:sigma-70 family RNA polymerase sigma factor [Pseudomonadota bacterium]MCP4915691.1 sigma-70 family RNA polymerase sigma factor [Pseudomonadota bacterium]
MGFLRGRVGSERAEELHQELWARVERRLADFDGRAPFRALLWTAARRLVIDDHRRSEVRPKLVSLEVERASRQSPLSDLSHRQLLAAVERAMADLDPATAQVVRWRLSENLSFKEIAERQDAKLNTVLSRMHRGVKHLRVVLVDHKEAG